MPDFLKLIIGLAIGAVAIVLGMGLVNMMKGGSANTSQQLMRWRVILQFIAIIIMIGVLFVKGRS